MKLTEQEYKDLIIAVATAISPVMVANPPEYNTVAENVAIKARDIADAVDQVLQGDF